MKYIKVILVCFICTSFLWTTPVKAQGQQSVIPNPAPWFWELPDNLHNFLEQLYLTVYFFQLPSNMAYLLEGIFADTTPTPTPHVGINSPTPTGTSYGQPTNTPTIPSGETSTLPLPWKNWQTTSNSTDLMYYSPSTNLFHAPAITDPTSTTSRFTTMFKTETNTNSYEVTSKFEFKPTTNPGQRFPYASLQLKLGNTNSTYYGCCDQPYIDEQIRIIQPTDTSLRIEDFFTENTTQVTQSPNILVDATAQEYASAQSSKTLWLRIVKQATSITTFASFDGTTWKQVRQKSHQIGGNATARHVIVQTYQQPSSKMFGWNTFIGITE